MRVLLLGSGGREHAIAWQLKRTRPDLELFCAPGNPGMAALGELVDLAVDDIEGIADYASSHAIDLTIVGPELPLSLGCVDALQERGRLVYGPSRAAAQLESSKVFAKEFLARHGIPTGDFAVTRDREAAREAAERFGLPVVLKADGLAAGKGVLIVQTADELDEALDVFFVERRFGSSGERVLVEEFLEGEEVSFIGLCDGQRFLPMATSKDYKRIGEGDTGPNTGGMGAHSPCGIISEREARDVIDTIMRPTLAGMSQEGSPFAGFLYAGLMLTDRGPMVLEFNVRLGDPEAQALLLRLEDDLAGLLLAGARGDFGQESLGFSKDASACLVLACEGYPDRPRTGDVIEGIESAAAENSVEVFHAGTKADGGSIVSAGGRTLNVVARGADLGAALERAYRAAEKIAWPAKAFRRDIGRRVLERTSN